MIHYFNLGLGIVNLILFYKRGTAIYAIMGATSLAMAFFALVVYPV